MKKATLIVFLLFAACSSGSENIDASTSEIESEEVTEIKPEEDSSNGVRFLEFPGDTDIDYFFPCIDQKGLNAIPAPQQFNNKIRIEFDEGYDQEYIDSFEVAFNECAEEQGSSNEKQTSKNIEVNQNLMNAKGKAGLVTPAPYLLNKKLTENYLSKKQSEEVHMASSASHTSATINVPVGASTGTKCNCHGFVARLN